VTAGRRRPAVILTGVLAMLGAAPAQLVAQSDTTPPPHEATSYDITLVTSDTGAHVLAEVQSGWRLRSVWPVELELDSTLRVVRVLVDGKPNTRLYRTMYARQGSEVVVPHEKSPGDTLTTRVRYHGIPRGGFRVGPDRTGARSLAGETAAGRARLWLPVPDGESGRTTVVWNVQARKDQRAVANGTLERIDTLAFGHTTWHYRLDTPVPLDALAVAVGRYAVTTLPHAGCRRGCVPVTLWTAPEDSIAAAAGAFRRAGEMVDFMSGFLGDFPYPGLAHVASPLAPAGRPGASIVLWDEARVHAGAIDEDEIARATAAQWLGNAVSESGPVAERPSPAVGAYLAWLWRRQGGGARLETQALPRDLDSIRRLHQMVGDSAFAQGLRRYVETNRHATAAPGALERAMSEAAGRGLEWSFAGRSP
jgi:aminopeptidase N